MSDLTPGSPEVTPDMPDAEYRASEGLSATSAKWILRSPAHYRYYMDNRRERTAFDIGHAFHAKVLGVGASVAVLDFPDRRTKAYKEAEQEARDAGMTPVLAKDYQAVNDMAEVVLNHSLASKLLSLPGKPEVALSAIDPESGARVKCRVDWLTDEADGRRVIPVDLKTTQDASYEGFVRSIAKYRYDIQGAMVKHLIRLDRGIDPAPFTLIAVETDPPHAVAVHDIPGDFSELADASLRRAITRYAECVESGQWPSYPPIIHHAIAPAWLSIAEEREEFDQ